MGGESSLPLDAAVLNPLQTASAIGDDDEYWDLLFSRSVVKEKGAVLHVQPCLKHVCETHPNTLKQLVRLGLVRLIDLVHKCDLTLAGNEARPPTSMCTIVTLIQGSIVEMHQSGKLKEFMGERYNECGRVGDTLSTVLVRMLHLRNATLMPGQHHWCSALDDDGRHDELRLAVVETLLILHVLGVEFLEFPRALFAASVINALRFYFRPTMSMTLVSEKTRTRLLQAALILMLRLRITVNEMQITRDDYPEIFGAIMASINRKNGDLDSDTFMLPLLAQYFDVADNEIMKKLSVSFVENVMHILDWWKGTDSARAVLLMIARLCQVPEVVRVMDAPCPEYENDGATFSGSLGSVVLEVAIRNSDGEWQQEIVAVIGCLMLTVLQNLAPDVLAHFLSVVSRTCLETKKMVVCNIHWILSRGISDNRLLASQVLKSLDFFKGVNDQDPAFEECCELQLWIREQNRVLKDARDDHEILKMLAEASKCVPLQEMSDEQPPVPFDYEKHRQEIVRICTTAYLIRHYQSEFID